MKRILILASLCILILLTACASSNPSEPSGEGEVQRYESESSAQKPLLSQTETDKQSDVGRSGATSENPKAKYSSKTPSSARSKKGNKEESSMESSNSAKPGSLQQVTQKEPVQSTAPPVPASSTTPAPVMKPTPVETPVPSPITTPIPTPEPTPEPDPDPTPQPTHKPTPEPVPEPTSDPVPEPEPEVNWDYDTVISVAISNCNAEWNEKAMDSGCTIYGSDSAGSAEDMGMLIAATVNRSGRPYFYVTTDGDYWYVYK